MSDPFSIVPDQGSHINADVDAAVDPFCDHDLDFELDTGADWFRMALSASLGQVQITGIQVAPACESLAKTTYARASNYQHYDIHFNSKHYPRAGAGDGLDLSNPPAKDFVGFRSNASLESAFEPTGLSTSAVRRFTAASQLAAYAVSAGQAESEAMAFAEAAVGSRIPEAARDAIIVPTQFATRSLVPFGKASHAIYSRGTYQRRVTVDDSSIGPQTIGEGKSMDWGRNVVIARFIGELNCRCDPRFAKLAEEFGVPYMLVSGTAADTRPSDYFLPDPGLIPRLAPGHAGVPPVDNILGRIVETVNTQMATIVRELRAAGRETDHQRALQVAVRMTQMRKKHVQTVATGTEVMADATRQRFTAEEAHARVTKSRTGFDAAAATLERYLKADKSLGDAAARYLASFHPAATQEVVGNRQADRQKVLRVLQDDGFWVMAKQQVMGVDDEEARRRVDRAKRTLFGIRDATSIPRRAKVDAGPMFGALIRAATKGRAPQPNERAAAFPPMRAYDENLRTMVYKEAGKHFEDTRKYWAKHYEERARAFGTVEPEGQRHQAILYGAAARAFKRLQPADMFLMADGYIDGENAESCWIMDVAKRYCEKRNMPMPEIDLEFVRTAEDVADELDEKLHPRVSFLELVRFVNARIQMIAGEFAQGSVDVTMPPEDYEEVPEPIHFMPNLPPMTEASGTLGAMMSEDELAMLADLDPELLALLSGAADQPSDSDMLMRAVAAFPDPSWSETFAVANGFGSYREAFQAIRTKAAYDEENEFTKVGMKYIREVGRGASESKGRDDDNDYGVLDW